MPDSGYCICGSTDIDRFMIDCGRCKRWFHGECVGVNETMGLSTVFTCQSCRGGVNRPTSNKQPSTATDNVNVAAKKAKLGPGRPPKAPKRCEMCIGCRRNVDCGKCEACKRGCGTAPVGETCVQRRCVNANVLKTPTKAALKQTSSSKTTPKAGKQKKDTATTATGKKSHKKRPPAGMETKTGAGNSEPIFDAALLTGGTRSSRQAYLKFLQEAGVELSPELMPKKRGGGKHNHHHHSHTSTSASSEPRLIQCYNPECVNAAREQSKYCSDACGEKLAELRLQKILPGRLADWEKTPSVASEVERVKADRIKAQMEAIVRELEAMQQYSNDLRLWVEESKRIEPTVESDDENENDGDDTTTAGNDQLDQSITDEPMSDSVDDHFVSCPCCGIQTSIRLLPKHAARCSAKIESATSYGSSIQSANPFDIFCHTKTKTRDQVTYCKRLRVLCPEHSKRDKFDDNQICACPLKWQAHGLAMPDRPSNTDDWNTSVCRRRAKDCTDHYDWARLYQGTIDNRRLNLLFKHEELQEQSQALEVSQKDRGNVMGLLMHATLLAQK